MKYLLLTLCLLGVIPAFGQHWGLGLRVGDPTGISAKRYMARSALEINLGRTHSWYHPHWHRDHFHDWYKGRGYAYDDYGYTGYRAAVPLSLQVHYLFRQTSFGKKSVSGLEWYWGLGGQFRNRTYYYNYRYKVPGDPSWHYVTDERVNDLDLGVDGVIGIEYTFKEVPLSIAADITLFMEIADDPFIFWPQSGLAIRYNFN